MDHANDLSGKQATLSSAVLYHDSSNSRVGVGTASPAKILHVHADSAPSGDLARFSSNGNFSIQHIVNGTDNFQFTHMGSKVMNYYKGTEVVKYDDDGATFANGLLVTADAPASASASGVEGEIRCDDSWLYVCTVADTWRRIAIPSDDSW